MPEIRSDGRLPEKRVAVLVARYNHAVTLKLLDGAREALAERRVPDDRIDVVWVPGTFELPSAAARIAATNRYAALIALGAVIRGETAHFHVIADATARGLQHVAIQQQVPITFGVLTTDTLEQALARAGGPHGNKGFEAAMAALELADVLDQVIRAPD